MTLQIKLRNRLNFILAIVRLFVGLGLLAGCATGPKAGSNLPPAQLKQDEIAQLNEKLLASARINSDPSDFLLGPGDLLQIKVFEAEELNTTVRVSSRGYVTLPLLGTVPIKGMSAREAEETIENKYREQYIKDPHVSIFVEEHFSQRITLMGQFRNPGTYDYLSRQRLLDVMALGGGLSEKAGRVVQIRRYGGTPEAHSVFFVDLDQLIKEGKTEHNIQINSADVLFVPEAGTFFVDGAVRRPGSYYIKHKTTMQEAFMEAGGLAPYADKQQATLLRYTGNGERRKIDLDLSQPESLQMEIKDRDVIIAAASTYGKLIHGLRMHIGIPGFGLVGYTDPEK
jgi:polysaccharide export outer membrane protein